MPVMLDASRLVGTSRVRVDAGPGGVIIAARAQRHDDFFQRAVARPLAQSVDRAFDLARPGLDGRQAVGHRHAQVVVAMDADDRPVDVRHAVSQRADDFAHVGGVA